jgi:multimeric flavodoxin WrbA
LSLQKVNKYFLLKGGIMIEPVLTKEGQQVLDAVLNRRYGRLPYRSEEEKEKYYRLISLVMNERGVKEGDKELVKEAIRLRDDKRRDTMFNSVDDPTMVKRLFVDPNVDLGAYYAMPREVKRWVIPHSQPTKPPQEMRVLAFNASPRIGGNTDVLIDEALRGAKDAGAASIEKIQLQKIKLNFCIGCFKCKDPGWEGFCSQKNDDVNDAFQKVADSDAIIIGFPIYMGRVSAQLCAFIDRWLSGKQKLGAGKKSMVIGTWGVPNVDLFDYIIDTTFSIMYGSGIEPAEAISACGFEGMLHGLDDKGKPIILRFPEGLEKAYQAGKSLVTG